MKIRPVGADLFLEDGQTDMTKLIVAFRNFADTLTKQSCYLIATTYILLNEGRIKSHRNEEICMYVRLCVFIHT